MQFSLALIRIHYIYLSVAISILHVVESKIRCQAIRPKACGTKTEQQTLRNLEVMELICIRNF